MDIRYCPEHRQMPMGQTEIVGVRLFPDSYTIFVNAI